MTTTGSLVRATIGNYRVLELIGAGGMGEVYRGVHLPSGTPVAIKVLTRAGTVPKYLERFRNEARIQSQLRHPNIALLHEFIEYDQMPCIVMEFVDGETLERCIERRGALPEHEAASLTASVVDAVGYLHARDIVHRDIKLSNVKVSSSGVVKLLDFGIAKGPGSPKLTATGSVIGTLQSLAPEQLDGAPASQRTDIWSLGVLLYELATGQHPFAAEGADGITARIRAAQFTTPSTIARVSPGIDRVVGQCLRPRPKDRYASCDAMLGDLRDIVRTSTAERAAASLPLVRRLADMARDTRLTIGLGALALVMAVRFVAMSSPNQTGRGERDTPAVLPPPVVPATKSDTPRPPATQTVDLREVTINIVAGVAEVWRDGSLAGHTPFRISGPLGAHVSLTLRQAGYEDEVVNFDITEGRTEYSMVMRSKQSPDRPIPPSSGVPLLSFAWFALPWRRKPRLTPGVPATGERAVGESHNALSSQSRIIVSVATDPGCVRQENEDTVRVARAADATTGGDGLLLAAVLDGMGGHAAGEVASRLAADTIENHYTDVSSDPGESLERAIQAANKAVYAAAQADAALQGMGTTVIAMVVRDGNAWCAHVGDSRCYLVRDGEIFLMTEDHSAVMAMVRDGSLSRDQARTHPDKNVISRALGSRQHVEITVWPRPFVLRPGDRFVLCSDGLYDVVGDEDVRDVVSSSPPHVACERLIAMTRERGAPDTVSVLVLAVPEPLAERSPRHTRDIPIPT
jgi:serine/threonine protein phosphatase PrpC/serine/threonine protein kinase